MDDTNDPDIWTPAVFKKENMPSVLPVLSSDNILIGTATYHAGIGYSLRFEPEEIEISTPRRPQDRVDT